jgi:hypothetical protein
MTVRGLPSCFLIIVVAASACGDDRRGGAPPRADSVVAAEACASAAVGDSAPAPAARPTVLRVVQVGAFADTARAAAFADSLAGRGWRTARERATVRGQALERVFVVPPQGGELPALFARSLRAMLPGAAAAGRELAVAPPAVTMVPVVARGTHGMIALTRWAHSPDRCALLVVEDPAAVEAEALPDGFVYAREGDADALQVDGVWDVAPTPDWRRLAYGEGTVVSARERDSLSTAQWDSLVRRFGEPVDSVRAAAFPASGMAIAFGFARSFIVTLEEGDGGNGEAGRAPRRVPGFGGWRVGWTPDGGTLAIGGPPRRVQDDEAPAEWVGVSPITLERRGPLAPGAVARVAWVEGPMLDIVPADTAMPASGAPVTADGVVFRAREGWIVAEREDGGTEVLAPGAPLAATRNGGWVVALVPALDPRPYDHRVRLVVLRTGR